MAALLLLTCQVHLIFKQTDPKRRKQKKNSITIRYGSSWPTKSLLGQTLNVGIYCYDGGFEYHRSIPLQMAFDGWFLLRQWPVGNAKSSQLLQFRVFLSESWAYRFVDRNECIYLILPQDGFSRTIERAFRRLLFHRESNGGCPSKGCKAIMVAWAAVTPTQTQSHKKGC